MRSADSSNSPGRARQPSRVTESNLPGGPKGPPFSLQNTHHDPQARTLITSPHNEKLKLVRKLGERKQREREGLFVSEGEDLVRAGLTAGATPELLLEAPGAGLGGEEGEPELLAAVSALGSGTRAIAVWPERWATAGSGPCVYLHGVGDPGNVGTVIRTAQALLGGVVVLGPDCADPFSPKAVRASMGAIFAQPV